MGAAPRVIEAAWAGDAVRQAVEMTDLGARVVLVGIPGDDLGVFQALHRAPQGAFADHEPPHEAHLSARDPAGGSGAVTLDRLVTHRFRWSRRTRRTP